MNIYVRSRCSACTEVKAALDARGYRYIQLDADDPQTMADAAFNDVVLDTLPVLVMHGESGKVLAYPYPACVRFAEGLPQL